MHPIYALWAHPRSMSTAIERIMRERGDLECVHEPFMYDYYVHRRVRNMPHFDVDPSLPQSYADIRDDLLARAEKQPVFIKDMSYYVMPEILDDTVFLERLRNVFLVRSPMAAITSYHKLDPDVSCEEIGIAAQWDHFVGLTSIPNYLRPVVIRAEDVRQDAPGVVGRLWKQLGLLPADHAFDWQSNAPEDWQQVSGWHGKVMQSQGIRKPAADRVANEQTRFKAACREAPHLQEYLETHWPAYVKLSDQAQAG